MHLTCPHCRCSIERPEGAAAAEILCPTCGQTSPPEGTETKPGMAGADRREPGPVAIGQTISHYYTLGPLGAGGMGVVYKAQDTRLGRSVALKFLPPEYAQDPQRLERFQREARTASALNHPHICTMYDVDEHEGLPFLVMELIEGQTLRSLAAGRPSLTALIHLVGQVAKALAAAHAAGIMHRDIKPENIMVREDGYAKVLDFGLARRIPIHGTLSQATAAEVTEPGTVMGTVRYMSPEQARGETASSASDIFALGIVLYELTVGQHPFPADSQVGVLHAIVAQPPLPPTRLNPEIPAPLEGLLLRMLEKDPRLRPSAAEVDAGLGELARSTGGRPAGPELPSLSRHTVGRQHELAELRAGFESASAGRGLLLCVAGEPGIGKTTLVEQFLGELAAAERTCRLARGRCSERLAGTEAYLPFLEALEDLLHGAGGAAMAQVMKVVAPNWYVQLAPVVADDSSFARVPVEAKGASQERLKRELAAFLQEVARLQPLVLFLDDLHWADASTVDLLAYVSSKCAAMRLLLVLSYRPSDLLLSQHPFLHVKLELQGHGVCGEILLAFLSPPDVERYLALEFPEHAFPATFDALIHTRTEGNPLFMVDLVRYLRDCGVIALEQGRWTLTQSVADIRQELPESVRSMIQRKIDQLGEADRNLLVAASVQGQEFHAAVVSQVLALDAAEVEERLGALDRVHALVRCLGEREFPDATLTVHYRFVHVLYQNALYASLTPTRRASLSAAVAQALLGYYAEHSANVASDLALLFETGRDFARAADHFVLASENAVRVYANREAITLARRALANAEKLRGDARPARLLAAALHLAELLRVLSQFQEAIATFQLVETVARESADREALIRAICGMGLSLFPLRRYREVREQGQRALELAQAAQSSVGLASAEMVLGLERMGAGDLEAAEQLMDHAVPVLTEKGPRQHAVEAIVHRGSIHMWRSEYQAAERRAQEGLHRARELGIEVNLFPNLFQCGIALGNQGRLSEALAVLGEGVRLAEVNGARHRLSRFPNTLGWLHRELQDLETALRLDHEGVQLAQEVGFPKAVANSHINLGHDYLELGEPARAFQHLQEAERLYDQDVLLRWRFNIRLQAELASYAIARGDLKRATAHASASLKLAEQVKGRKHVAWAHKLLGDIAALDERVEDGQRHYAAALRVLQRHACPIIEWKILKAAAELAQCQRNDAAGADFLGRAQAVVQCLAGAIKDDKLRQGFLAAKPVRDLSS
jgi:tetratricopeptide (TPR) repeat protein/predicted Ser/Thr protein kinase